MTFLSKTGSCDSPKYEVLDQYLNNLNTILISLISSSWDKSDDDQNSCRWLKRNTDPFLISIVETLSSVLRFKKCFSTFQKFTTIKEIKILILRKVAWLK